MWKWTDRMFWGGYFFFSSSLVLFGFTESLWSSFAGGRQYGVWAGEWHSSCFCLPWWCSSPLPCAVPVNTLLAIPQTFVLRGLMDTREIFSKGIAPAMAHPKVREEERSHERDAGSVRSWWTHVTCADLQGCADKSGPAALAERGAKALAIRATLLLYGADVRFSPGCLKWKFIGVCMLFLKGGWGSG